MTSVARGTDIDQEIAHCTGVSLGLPCADPVSPEDLQIKRFEPREVITVNPLPWTAR